MVDLHIHSTFSYDSSLSPMEVCEIAIKRGIKIIAFTEHLELNPQDPGYGYFNYRLYKDTLSKLSKKFKNKLLILSGIEITYQREYEMEIYAYLRNKTFDIIIGSIHYVEKIPIDQWVQERESATIPKKFLPYFDELRSMCKSNLFNTIGHFDYFKKYMKDPESFNLKEYEKELRLLLKYIALKNLALEINTQGLRQFVNSPYPHWEILKMYKEEGGKNITIGSDAHSGCEIGYNIHESLLKILSMGFDKITLFNEGSMHQLPIQKLTQKTIGD